MHARELMLHTLRLAAPPPTSLSVIAREKCEGYQRLLVSFAGDEGEAIPGFLFQPEGAGPFSAVIVWHQHNSQWHLGKSEVAGLWGDPFQAFGPALAKRGVVVLAPDVLSFEDRRPHARGTEAHERDWLNHFNTMGAHLVRGDLFLRKVLDDARRATSALLAWPGVAKVGALGHSMGGLISLHHGVVDERLGFLGLSGSVARFSRRIAEGVPINMLELIPGLAARLETEDLLRALAPRPLLVVSSDEDRFSHDAEAVLAEARPAWRDPRAVTSLRVSGGHGLTAERFSAIVDWCVGM